MDEEYHAGILGFLEVLGTSGRLGKLGRILKKGIIARPGKLFALQVLKCRLLLLHREEKGSAGCESQNSFRRGGHRNWHSNICKGAGMNCMLRCHLSAGIRSVFAGRKLRFFEEDGCPRLFR